TGCAPRRVRRSSSRPNPCRSNNLLMKLLRHSFSPLRLRALLPLALAGVASAQPASPPVPPTLDLKTAVVFALENNFAIRQARERIKQQQGVVVEVSAREIPNVSASGLYQANDTSISQSSLPADRAWQINLTASQLLFAGGGV